LQPSSEPIPPDQFGPYEVYERLGLGGMATVCRAKKRGPAGFERSVALKRMLSHLSEDQSFVASFIREAKVSSLLVHPNIAQVYDFGRINGTYYIAMELVPGFDLRKLLRYANRANESIPLAVVLSILGEMCDALEYAHNCLDEQGTALRIVHRDISPSNIIVAHTGHTKVIDFGIAKANSRQLHTESGQVKGKLGYMSPEAALGMQIGPVSDVFSMGVVAWELVTASPLFSARSDFETMRKIREAEVQPPSTHNPACPPDLDRLIMSALVRQDQHRLASASQFRRGLDAVAAREGIHVGSRAVAEWMRQFIQPDDFALQSGRSVPQEAPTSVMRPSQRAALQRSHDEIALAAEIWGEDAGPNSIAAGPDFSIENPLADPAATTPMKAVAMPTAHVTPTRAPLPLPASPSYPNLPQSPAGYMPTPMQQIMPYAVPVRKSRTSRTGLFLVIGLALVAAVLVIVLVTKHSDPVATAPTPVEPKPSVAHLAIDSTPHGLPVTLDGKPAGTTPVKVEILAAAHHVEIKGATDTWTKDFVAAADANLDYTAQLGAAPVVATDVPTPSKPTPTVTPTSRPHHDTKDHHGHHVAEVEPPPVPEPTAEPTPVPVQPQVPKPQPVPTPPEPAKPARTPVVAATAVSKVSGELPVMRGDHDGDVLVKMCIDDSGKVISAKIVKTSPDMPSDLVGALQQWRYKPYLKDGKAQPVCFALSLRVVVKNDN
jgi:serine/threonine protein kinase